MEEAQLAFGTAFGEFLIPYQVDYQNPYFGRLLL